MEIHPSDILISIINIVVLFFLLRLFLWKHVNRFLTERSLRIQGEIGNAEKMHKKAETTLAKYDKKIAKLKEEGQEIIAQSQKEANAQAETILADAKAKASDIMREAEHSIEIDKKQAIKDTRTEIAQLATEMAAQILEREVRDVDNNQVIEQFFRREGF